MNLTPPSNPRKLNYSTQNSTSFVLAAVLLAVSFPAYAQAVPGLGLTAPNPSQWTIMGTKIGELGAKAPVPDETPLGEIHGGKDGRIRHWSYQREGRVIIDRWFFDKLFLERVEGGIALRDLRTFTAEDLIPAAASADFDYVDWAMPTHRVGQVPEGKNILDYYAAPSNDTIPVKNLPSASRAIREATKGLPGVRELWVDSTTRLPVQVISDGYLYRFNFSTKQHLAIPPDLLETAKQHEESLRSPQITR